MNTQTNAINWFEIPVTDMARAKHFYQVIFSIHLEDMQMADMHLAGFPYDMGSGKASGALALSNLHKPSSEGSLLYLNANPDLSEVLEKVEAEGGTIVLPKTQIDPQSGYMALFIDTEGNTVGLHSQQ